MILQYDCLFFSCWKNDVVRHSERFTYESVLQDVIQLRTSSLTATLRYQIDDNYIFRFEGSIQLTKRWTMSSVPVTMAEASIDSGK